MSDFGKILADIDEQLEVEQARLNELEAIRDRVSRLKQAKRALEAEAKPKRDRKGKANTGSHNPNWTPNAQSVQAILTVLEESDRPLPIKEIEQKAGWSHSHTDQTIRYLRKHEMVRLAGKEGTAHVYAPMNGSSGLKETEHASNPA